MDTMTLLPQSRPLTYADLETMPDDGHRYELLDGALIVTPAPSVWHQLISGRLYLALSAACPDELVVLAAPTDVVLADDTALQPDLLIVRRDTLGTGPLHPLLAVEILSPSTRQIDLTLKKARYEIAGCPAYWVVDPEGPAVTGWDLRDGEYAEIGRASADELFTAENPVPVAITPARLLD